MTKQPLVERVLEEVQLSFEQVSGQVDVEDLKEETKADIQQQASTTQVTKQSDQDGADKEREKASFQALEDYIRYVDKLEHETLEGKLLMGYPMNGKDTAALTPLRTIMARHTTSNNCGDPFDDKPRPYLGHTMETERALLRKLMEPWGATEQAWGYVTTGGTEGVTKGMQAGLRRMHEKRSRIMLLWSEQAHYCVEKAASLLLGQYAGFSHLSAKIPPNAKGEMDLNILHKVVESSRYMGVEGFVVMATLGTTFLGANDDIRGIMKVFEKNNFERDDVYIHIDGALNGGWWYLSNETPKYKIAEDFDSISVSGHKWYGGFIGGVVMIAKPETAGKEIKYIKMVDRMIAGSRNGDVSVLWTARLLQLDWPKEFEHCMANADYLEGAFEELGILCTRQGLNVAFPKPSNAMTARHQLMTVDDHAQIFSLPHLTRSHMEMFMQEYADELSKGLVAVHKTDLLIAFNEAKKECQRPFHLLHYDKT